jgi:hypothetical protein
VTPSAVTPLSPDAACSDLGRPRRKRRRRSDGRRTQNARSVPTHLCGYHPWRRVLPPERGIRASRGHHRGGCRTDQLRRMTNKRQNCLIGSRGRLSVWS